MIKVENIVGPSPAQWAAVVRGVRNPMNSWDKSDSIHCLGWSWLECNEDCKYYNSGIDGKNSHCESHGYPEFYLGDKDLKLMQNLADAGPDHGKYLRQLNVWATITAPMFWWLQFDTYKVGVTSNSTSKMHRLTEKEFEVTDFYYEGISEIELWTDNPLKSDFAFQDINPCEYLEDLIVYLNKLRRKYLATKDKCYWQAILYLLPESYMQTRTVCISFQALRNMVHQRWDHKLPIWRQVLKALLSGIPHSKELIVGRAE